MARFPLRPPVVVGLALAALLVPLITLAATSALADASFMGLGDLPGGAFNSLAWAVSADGSVVVGEGSSDSGTEAFRWTKTDGMVGLGDLAGGSFGSSAHGVSADGSAVVGEGTSTAGTEAFRWTQAGGMVGLGDLAGGIFRSSAWGVSADGSVVAGTGVSPSGREAFRWTSGDGMVGLGNLPNGSESYAYGISANGSVVVGGSSSYVGCDFSSLGCEAFRWTSAEGMVALGEGGAATADGVSADGSVVVGSDVSPFRWTQASGMVRIGAIGPAFLYGEADAVSADGSVVVGLSYRLDGTPSWAFIWDSTNGIRDLNQLLADLGVDLKGWHLLAALGVSGDGATIVGYGINPDAPRTTEAWIAVIPEPSTGCLVGLGLLALVGRRRT